MIRVVKLLFSNKLFLAIAVIGALVVGGHYYKAKAARLGVQVEALQRELNIQDAITRLNNSIDKELVLHSAKHSDELNSAITKLRRIEQEVMNNGGKDSVCNIANDDIVRLLNEQQLLQGDAAP